MNTNMFDKAWSTAHWALIACTKNAQAEITVNAAHVSNHGRNDIGYSVSLKVMRANAVWGWHTDLDDIPDEMLDTDYFMSTNEAIAHARKVMAEVTKLTGLTWVEGKGAYARRLLCFSVVRSMWKALKKENPTLSKGTLLKYWGEYDWKGHSYEKEAELFFGAGMFVISSRQGDFK